MKLKEIKNQHYGNHIAFQCYYEDERGLRQGEYRDWYSNGNPWEICNYKDGKRHGDNKIYSENGSLFSYKRYINGKSFGISIINKKIIIIIMNFVNEVNRLNQ